MLEPIPTAIWSISIVSSTNCTTQKPAEALVLIGLKIRTNTDVDVTPEWRILFFIFTKGRVVLVPLWSGACCAVVCGSLLCQESSESPLHLCRSTSSLLPFRTLLLWTTRSSGTVSCFLIRAVLKWFHSVLAARLSENLWQRLKFPD